MKIAKEFRWEMGHRLKFHEGQCKNLHGHSYKLLVELAGTPDENGIVMDYYDVKKVIAPLIEKLDHSFMVHSEDKELLEALQTLNSKHVVTGFHSTAENLCEYFLGEIKKCSLPSNIYQLRVKVFETETTYAEESSVL
ncbi:MAG: 6-carboxytetrahydropterin synthase [Bacteroidetes bacterium]|nr:6-carboxytetrahydropterin synthase [Bacteroidota bacterium]MBU2508598.1 6-carboxytetrahydropterin synthase [Bacteroidota bacterium]